MGLFVLDLEKRPTRKSRIITAVANLNLYLEELETGQDYDHLLELSKNYIALAIKTPVAGEEGWQGENYQRP